MFILRLLEFTLTPYFSQFGVRQILEDAKLFFFFLHKIGSHNWVVGGSRQAAIFSATRCHTAVAPLLCI